MRQGRKYSCHEPHDEKCSGLDHTEFYGNGVNCIGSIPILPKGFDFGPDRRGAALIIHASRVVKTHGAQVSNDQPIEDARRDFNPARAQYLLVSRERGVAPFSR